MKIVIAGGTGFVGKALTKHFLTQKHYVYILTRNADKAARDPKLKYVEWMQENSQPEEHVEGADVFINLAGVSLNSYRWTDERKSHRGKSPFFYSRNPSHYGRLYPQSRHFT